VEKDLYSRRDLQSCKKTDDIFGKRKRSLFQKEKDLYSFVEKDLYSRRDLQRCKKTDDIFGKRLMI